MNLKNNYVYILLAYATSCGLLLTTSCKKDPVSPDPEVSIAITPLPRPVGVAKGEISSKSIGAAGGTLVSADGRLQIAIPAGALTEDKLISVQPVEQTNIAGIGLSYRLTPHQLTFKKKVTLSLGLEEVAEQIGLPQTLGFAYQQEDQVWKYVGASRVDMVQKTISYETTHFSDWSLMNRLSLSPYEATVEPGQSQSVRALIYTQTKWDDLLTPLTGSSEGAEPGYPVGTPAALPSRFIDTWELTGPGKIVKADASTVTYQAPAAMNGSAAATVSLKLKAPRAGTYLLLSNLHLSGNGWIELSIAGAAPVRFPASSAAKSGNQYLLSNPENEGGGYFLLRWNGGVGEYGYSIANGGNHFHFQTSTTTYMSRYLDQIVKDIVPSGGKINITKLENGWVEGAFHVTNAGYGQFLMRTTTANGRFRAKVFDSGKR